MTNAVTKNIKEKGLKEHQKMKHNSSQYEKVGNLFNCGTCEKAGFFGRFILSHLTLSQQQTTLQTKYACKEYLWQL